MAETKASTVKKVVVKTPAARKTVVQSSVSVDLFDITGKSTSTVTLSEVLFNGKVNNRLMAQAVRVYLANQRQGTVDTKTRSEVIGSTRKIYRQKGTGRARHGSIKAPIFVHGGVAHGPHQQDHTLSMPQKMRRAALISALTVKQKEKHIRVIEGISGLEPKTKSMISLIKALALSGTQNNVLVVLPSSLTNVTRSIKNIQGVKFEMANLLNTYQVMNTSTLVFAKEALATLEETYNKKEQA